MDKGVADATSDNWNVLKSILAGWTKRAGVVENLDYNRYFVVFQRAEVILTKSASTPTPSVFKQGAAFLLSFINEAPLRAPFPEGCGLPSKILTISNHQNVVTGFEYVRHSLEHSVVQHSGRGELPVKKQILISSHQYCDLIHCLSVISKQDPLIHFATIALLLETLVYRDNPEVADPDRF